MTFLKAKLPSFARATALAVLLLLSVKYAMNYSLLDGLTRNQYAALQQETDSFAAEPQSVSYYRPSAKKSAMASEARSRSGNRFSAADSKAAIPPMIVKSAQLNLQVSGPLEELTRIEKDVAALLGLVVNSSVQRSPNGADTVTMIIRVPLAKLDELRDALKRRAKRVELDHVEARDVTKDFIDTMARLKNMEAEEGQYRAIMLRAHTVEDTLRVTERLQEVRAEIEQLQGTINYLRNQSEMAILQVSLSTEVSPQVVGFRWRPLYQLKTACRAEWKGLLIMLGL